MKSFSSFIAFLFILLLPSITTIENLCPVNRSRRFIDISTSKIEKSSSYTFDLKLHDSSFTVSWNNSQCTFHGNFSTLIIKSAATQQENIYHGIEMMIKTHTDHAFSRNKLPDLEIQIAHESQNFLNGKKSYVILSQLFMVSKFTGRVSTFLQKYFNSTSIVDGGWAQTSSIIKLLKNFPMLMYKGNSETYPCRNDLLCMIRRQYQLIGQEDLLSLKKTLKLDNSESQINTIPYERQKIYEIQQTEELIGEDNEISLNQNEL